MKTLPIIALLCATNICAAGVYKCDVGGKLVYQQTPCATGNSEQLRIAPAPSQPARSTPMLRESERALLDELESEREALEYEREADRQRRESIAIERAKARAAEREARAQETRNRILIRSLR